MIDTRCISCGSDNAILTPLCPKCFNNKYGPNEHNKIEEAEKNKGKQK